MSDPLTIIHGDALSSLRRLLDESVQCCVTSPPYWGLRDYGLEPGVWDATVECDHEFGPMERGKRKDILPQDVTTPNSRIGTDERQNGAATNGGHFCHCGAWRGCLGLEPTPDLYVSHLVEIFREVKRVLRRDATVWLNLGDSYCANGKGGRDEELRSRGKNLPRGSSRWGGGNNQVDGLKTKDLIGIPWLTAFAFRADGWYLRSDVVWSKPNPMPESVADRPTKSHEYIFLLSKDLRYYYDAAAIQEESTNRASGNKGRKFRGDYGGNPDLANTHQGFAFPYEPTGKRNRRSVWTIPTQSFSEAHFATFPPDLIKPCILAGAPIGGVVLDPFAGSGTTGKVAIEFGRKAILIEPKAEYVEMIKRRCQTTIGLPISA
jgi:DNA modification methylase